MQIQLLIAAIDRLVESNQALALELRNDRANSLPTKNNLELLLEDLVDGLVVRTILDIGQSTLYRAKKSKVFRTVRIGSRDYYSRAEVEKYADYFKK